MKSILILLWMTMSRIGLCTSYEFFGDLTYYSGAGSGGSCSSSYVPEGFTTVAMNNPQYSDGLACGSCLEATYHIGGESVYFKAIVDNLCPECAFGDLDLGETGDGRWSLEWSFIKCPPVEPIVTTQGSNSFYGKVKIEGQGPINSVLINGQASKPTPDGFWVIEDSTGSLGCGPNLDIELEDGTIKNICADGSLFGGACSNGKTCETAKNVEKTEKPVEKTEKTEEPVEKTEKPVEKTEEPVEKNEPEIDILPKEPEEFQEHGESEELGCAEEYRQCGGKNYQGPKSCCESTHLCIVHNEYYSQCLYIETPGEKCQSKWKQCGGIGWEGETCCRQGTDCQFINSWYSHCL